MDQNIFPAGTTDNYPDFLHPYWYIVSFGKIVVNASSFTSMFYFQVDILHSIFRGIDMEIWSTCEYH